MPGLAAARRPRHRAAHRLRHSQPHLLVNQSNQMKGTNFMGLDIRWPIGLMFTLIGVLLMGYGAVNRTASLTHAGGSEHQHQPHVGPGAARVRRADAAGCQAGRENPAVSLKTFDLSSRRAAILPGHFYLYHDTQRTRRPGVSIVQQSLMAARRAGSSPPPAVSMSSANTPITTTALCCRWQLNVTPSWPRMLRLPSPNAAEAGLRPFPSRTHCSTRPRDD